MLSDLENYSRSETGFFRKASLTTTIKPIKTEQISQRSEIAPPTPLLSQIRAKHGIKHIKKQITLVSESGNPRWGEHELIDIVPPPMSHTNFRSTISANDILVQKPGETEEVKPVVDFYSRVEASGMRYRSELEQDFEALSSFKDDDADGASQIKSPHQLDNSNWSLESKAELMNT